MPVNVMTSYKTEVESRGRDPDGTFWFKLACGHTIRLKECSKKAYWNTDRLCPYCKEARENPK